MRTTYQVLRPTWLQTLAAPLEIDRSRALYRTVEVHSFEFRPRQFELIASTSSVPQLEGFVQHLFRAISRANGGAIYVGRAKRVRLGREAREQLTLRI